MTTLTSEHRGAHAQREPRFKWKQCAWYRCQKWFRSFGGAQDYCSKECEKKERQFEYLIKSRETDIQRHFNRCEFMIIADVLPAEEGGFVPGSLFTRADMVSMLALKSLSEGAKVKHIPTGNIYHVHYGMAGVNASMSNLKGKA